MTADDCFPGVRVVLRDRPLTGRGELVREDSRGRWRVALDDGGAEWRMPWDLLVAEDEAS